MKKEQIEFIRAFIHLGMEEQLIVMFFLQMDIQREDTLKNPASFKARLFKLMNGFTTAQKKQLIEMCKQEIAGKK